MKGLQLLSFIYWLSMALAPVMNEAVDVDYSSGTLTSSLKIIVGGYQPRVNMLEFNLSTQKFNNISASPPNSTGDSPSFIGFSPDGRYLFATNEVSNFGGFNQTGSVSSFKIQPDGKIRPISIGLTGADPVSLAVSPNGENLIVAEYTGGSWSRFSVNHLGEFKSPKPIQVKKYHGSGPIKGRQDHSFIHQVVYSKTGDLVFFVDLGGDSVYVHRVNQFTGEVDEIPHEIKFPSGTAPRHLSLIEKDKKEYDIYLISELSNQIFTIRLTDHHELKSSIKQKFSTLPHGENNTTTFAAAEVMVSRDGRFVYGSNRQTDFNKPITDNSIVMFERDLRTGLLIQNSKSSPTWFPITIGGKTPRHFSFSHDLYQSFMILGCQQSNTLVILQRNPQNGHLKLLSSTTVIQPAVQLFLPKQYIHYSD